jgi:Cys-rich repeat protein
MNTARRSIHTVSFWTRTAITLVAYAFVLVTASPAAAMRCIVDVDGANDDPGQKDVTQFCVGLGEDAPFDVHAMASYDLTDLSGSNTADLCLLFDSNTDGKINVAVCTTLAGSPAKVSEVRMLTCNDSWSDKCGGAVKINKCSISGASCLSDTQCGTGETCSATFNTRCLAMQMPSDPFPQGDNSPMDTVVSCAIDLEEFGAAGVGARLINMGAYSSSALSSDLSDAVLPPMCTGDADCGAGEVCHLASGECYKPEVTGCTDNSECAEDELCDVATGICTPGGCTDDSDCPAGKVCNVEAGVCETPIDTGCHADVDCAFGLVCDLESGDCVDAGPGCAIDSDCPAGQVCNASTGICEDATSGNSCTTDSDCVSTEVCDPVSRVCVDPNETCSSDADCTSDKVCNLSTGLCEVVDVPVCSVDAGACDEQCSICSGGHCLSICGNPYDAVGTGVTVTDALFILRSAVGLEQCGLCVCDVNSSDTVTAVDALAALRLVVRLPEVLSCPGYFSK